MDLSEKLLDCIDRGALQEFSTLIRLEESLARFRFAPGVGGWEQGGWTPLHRAVWKNEVEIIRFLIDEQVDLDARDDAGRSALHNSLETGADQIRDLLLAQGAEVDAASAAIMGEVSRLEPLCAQDPGFANDGRTGLSPLEWAAFGNQLGSLGVLLHHGANISEPGALHCAATVNASDFIRELCQAGADPNGKDCAGRAPLHAAATMAYCSGAIEATQALLDAGARVNELDDLGSSTVLDTLDEAREQRDESRGPAFEALEQLLEKAGGRRFTGPK